MNLKKISIFHAPLKEGDAENQTVGCRHTNPDICSSHSLPRVCAFSRADGICMKPPSSWSKQFKKLNAGV
jgi:hypothetical protein